MNSAMLFVLIKCGFGVCMYVCVYVCMYVCSRRLRFVIVIIMVVNCFAEIIQTAFNSPSLDLCVIFCSKTVFVACTSLLTLFCYFAKYIYIIFRYPRQCIVLSSAIEYELLIVDDAVVDGVSVNGNATNVGSELGLQTRPVSVDAVEAHQQRRRGSTGRAYASNAGLKVKMNTFVVAAGASTSDG